MQLTRFCIRLFLILACVSTAFFAAAADSKPNVLFVAIDDLNTRLNCYGEQHIHSPHIDRLAERGIRFDRAYCQYPSCGPSRASLLTGLRPRSTGILNNQTSLRERLPDVVTLPQHFRNENYFTARVGKIFHQGVPIDIGKDGLDDPLAWDVALNPSGRDRREENLLVNYTPQLLLQDRMSYLAADGTDLEQTDGMVATRAIELLEQHRQEPFFMAVGFYRPHIPYIAPREYFSLYDLARTPLPTIPRGYRDTVPAAALASTRTWPNFGTTPRQARECILAYDACVSFVDAQVGRLLDALDRLELSEQTIVVLWGDHGYHLGEHGLWRKNSLFEESARAPLIIAAPGTGIESGACLQVVEFVDVFPTIVELAGLKAPDGLEGKSLVPLMRNPKMTWNRPAYTQVQFGKNEKAVPGHSVRTQRWRYIEWAGGEKGEQLYDHQNDPLEMTNLAGRNEYDEVVSRMKKLLAAGF